MAEGYIKLYRQLSEHWLWKDKPFSKAQAWVDILFLVNHAPKKFPLGNELVMVERGSHITSIRKLAGRWGWSNVKVTSFLKLLKDDEMLDFFSDTKKTVLSVANYGIYQGTDNTKKATKRHLPITNQSPIHTNKNDKNDKNDKNKNIGEFEQAILDFKEMRKEIKHPLTAKAEEMLMTKLSKMGDDQIQIAILKESILNCWRGVFPLKDGQSQPQKRISPKGSGRDWDGELDKRGDVL